MRLHGEQGRYTVINSHSVSPIQCCQPILRAFCPLQVLSLKQKAIAVLKKSLKSWGPGRKDSLDLPRVHDSQQWPCAQRGKQRTASERPTFLSKASVVERPGLLRQVLPSRKQSYTLQQRAISPRAKALWGREAAVGNCTCTAHAPQPLQVHSSSEPRRKLPFCLAIDCN